MKFHDFLQVFICQFLGWCHVYINQIWTLEKVIYYGALISKSLEDWGTEYCTLCLHMFSSQSHTFFKEKMLLKMLIRSVWPWTLRGSGQQTERADCNYRMRAIITRSWSETALVYKPRILGLKNEEFSFLVQKWSVI